MTGRPIARLIAWLVGAIAMVALGSAPARAQTSQICLGRVITTLDFSSTPTRVSGTNLAVGAVYRYSNINTGIDALVQIVALNNGATLTTIDNNTAPAVGAPDLRAFFNPELAGSNARSADFQISFVVAGTNTPLPFDFAATAIDVDGDSGSLREYAEFQNIYAEYLLNNPTNLSVNASPPSAGNTRFEAATSANAPGIDPSANQNIVATFYSQRSGFRYRIGTLGTGTTTRLTSLQFTCPNLPAPITTSIPQDHTDAPATYGNVRHDIIAGFRLGAAITAETGPYNNATATADAGDDGVTVGTLRQTRTATATVTVTGVSGRLQAWFDWNRDGDFLDPGEQVALNQADNVAGDANAAVGTIGLSFTVPAAAVLGQTIARFRWSTQTGLPANTITARDGEVEDYPVTVIGVPILTLVKSSTVFDAAAAGLLAVPLGDVTYDITAANTGNASTDADSVVVTDTLPAQLTFFNGDMDGAGPATGPVFFVQTGTGLTFTAASDVRYSDTVTKPATFAACTYTPAAGYDARVKHICINPKGAMASASPAPAFTVRLRARIN